MIKKYLDFSESFTHALKYAENAELKEIVSLDNCIGKVLSKDIYCVKNLPSFNNSAMDGFAVKSSDANKTLHVKQSIFAGDKVEASLNENECYKIMTGAQVPSDVDTIIPIENVISYENDMVQIGELKQGSNLRLKGEEKAVSELLFTQGTEITASIAAVLASQGLIMIEVFKSISIAVVSTGNELKEPWETANEDEIFNCNSYALISLLKEKGFYATYTGVVPDNLEDSISFIKNLNSYDVIITTGGISMGDADFVGKAFLDNGLETIFHGVNIKPGRPIMMGKMKDTYVMCLPGNPLTAMVNMHLFAMPVLNKIQGKNAIYHDFDYAINTEEFKTKQGRVNVVLGHYSKGEFTVTQKNKYGSGMITVLSESNCIVVTNDTQSGVKEDERIKVIKFNCSYSQEQTDIFN